MPSNINLRSQVKCVPFLSKKFLFQTDSEQQVLSQYCSLRWPGAHTPQGISSHNAGLHLIMPPCILSQFVITLRQMQNGHRFAEGTLKHIFLNENVIILNKISLKFVPKGPFNNLPALVQIMAWRRSGDKPLFEPMVVRLLTHVRHSALVS